MANDENKGNGDLLEEIPSLLLQPEQKARWLQMGESPTYKLLRDPIHLQEFNRYNHGYAVWRDNGTLTYVKPHGVDDYPTGGEHTLLRLAFGDTNPTIYVAGPADDAVAETAAFFMSFEEPTEESFSFRMTGSFSRTFDFWAATPQCFKRLYELSPAREVTFQRVKLSVEQSVVLATRPQPTLLTLTSCRFDVGGMAFVDALEKRQSPFGALTIETSSAFDYYNLKRLCQVDVLDCLRLQLMNTWNLGLLPLSANVDSLECVISVSSLHADLESLSIQASELSLTLEQSNEAGTFPTEGVLSLFRRLASLGHFTKLDINFQFWDNALSIPGCVVQEFVRAALANCNLEALDLGTGCGDVQWRPHFVTLFEGLKEHKALRTARVTADNDAPIFDSGFIQLRYLLSRNENAFDPRFSYLRQLLSDSNEIAMMNDEGVVYTDGYFIDVHYHLSRIYRGSAALAVEPASVRLALATTAVIETASYDFQRCALFLSQNADVLHELIQFANVVDEITADDSSSQSNQDQKRRRRV